MHWYLDRIRSQRDPFSVSTKKLLNGGKCDVSVCF